MSPPFSYIALTWAGLAACRRVLSPVAHSLARLAGTDLLHRSAVATSEAAKRVSLLDRQPRQRLAPSSRIGNGR